jgi:hypothetical protein
MQLLPWLNQNGWLKWSSRCYSVLSMRFQNNLKSLGTHQEVIRARGPGPAPLEGANRNLNPCSLLKKNQYREKIGNSRVPTWLLVNGS